MALYGWSSFHFHRYNQFKVFPHAVRCAPEIYLPKLDVLLSHDAHTVYMIYRRTTGNGGSKRENSANHILIRRNPCSARHVCTFDVERLGALGVEITLQVRWTVLYFIGSKSPYCKYSTGTKTVFTRSAITPPKVSRFGWNLEEYAPNIEGWPWQVLGAIRAVATV